MALLADGLTDKQIAERMVVSRRTVETHLTSARRKTLAVNRTALVAAWLRLGDDG
ncbi:helix-turn-helix transcriptional regulator [Actinokineospora sp. NBRC 105648]|uniref:helix-turn-helix domain-containing protein n=1 Tax=Actinokineospora sp. NBRC 105648 TaxID=3032206 RepID=UPI0024A59D35|nr:helix-turn-helix transcriptional regulator [Actinokineospora sp. NBRC 105648]GLZ37013.1 hypothetical protein Acsp05_06380 [Actinokineospora sp. NBRC 105648]